MRILFISNLAPRLPLSGGNQRDRLWLECLQRVGGVTEFYLYDRPGRTLTGGDWLLKRVVRAGSLWDLALACWLGDRRRVAEFMMISRWCCPIVKRFRREVGALSQYDLIVCRYAQSAEVLRIEGRRRLIQDLDDHEAEMAGRERAMQSGSCLVRLRSQARGALRRRLRSRCLGATSPVPLVGNGEGFRFVATIPNTILGEPPAEVRASEGSMVLVVGLIDFRHFRDGLIKFIKETWPRVVGVVPEARLRLAGRGNWSPIRDILSDAEGSNIDFLGAPEDLSECYRTAAFVVVPNWIQHGSSIKLIEAFAYGRTAVVTEAVAKQTEPRGEPVPFLKAATTEELGVCCRLLLSDAAQRHELEKRARQTFLEYYRKDLVMERIDEVLRRVGEGGGIFRASSGDCGGRGGDGVGRHLD